MKKLVDLVAIGGTDYEAVAPSATNQVLGIAGATNDFLARLIVNVTTSATGNVAIKDGDDTALTLVPVNTPVGVYVVEVGVRSRAGAWQVTTGAGASVVAVGQFSI
jgi:hypothetical protein